MSRRFKAVAALAAAAALALTACTPNSGGSGEAAPQTLTLGVTTDPLSFDPAQAEEGSRIVFYQAAYDSLLKRKPDGTLEPMLATEWKVSDDRKQLTLKLRTGVKFSDGSEFDSAVVKTNLERFKTQNGPQAATLRSLASVETPDPSTVVLQLTAPDPALPIYLSNAAGFMASTKALTDPNLKSVPVGSGPYTLDKDNSGVGVKYTFVKNPDYWGDDLPYDKVIFSVLPDQQAGLNALRSGQVNATGFFSPALGAEALSADLSYHPSEAEYEGLVLFDRQGQTTPALADVRVRQAINYAIDRETLLKTFILGKGTVTNQIWGAKSAGYDESLEGTYKFDPQKAKSLLAEAGYGDGFELKMPTVPQFDPALMAAVVQMLQDVGIRASVTDVPFADFFGQLRGGKWSATYMRFFQPGDWQLINQFVAPNATWNGFHSTDPVVADYIQKIQVADEKELPALSKALNKHIVEQAWFAPFYRVEQQLFTDSKTTVQPQTEQATASLYNYSPKQ